MLHQSQSLESASWWKSVSVTQPQWSPAASLSCDKVPASLGQGHGCDPWQGFRIDQPGRLGGTHGLPAATVRAKILKQIGDICTPPTFILFGCAWQSGRQELHFCGHGGHAVCPSSQPRPLLPLHGEGAVQHEIGSVFLERQPLPSHFQVICCMPSAWDGDLPDPVLGNEQAGYPMEAEQHLQVWSPINK